ncbi:diaminopimelate epimerase [Saccharopolyspora gregorii]|uniref:diaminopimelate epimerase n=1 Tax=Saccharopolyspora gregorii TaxID=33914 RepID=UPI0021AC913B|nr:diaminopimelate epimerase [Saccharopolyspora gregorii]
MQFSEGPEFAKGHGTQNDFVVLPDPDGELKLTDAHVRALCDRRRGFGADGVLRVVPTAAIPDAPADLHPDVWFMDYRNADGSIAEMCGNGVRVFARYLVDSGLVTGTEFPVGTRAGLRQVRTHSDGGSTVDMGAANVFGESAATLAGRDFSGLAMDLGNPHLACVTDADLDALDLAESPAHDSEVFPNGVNVEFVRPTGPGRVRMRVHERGVGETRSCGTGTVAAAVAALRADGETTGSRTVDVPGGTVQVEVTGVTTLLTGPAVLVGGGRIDAGWWRQLAGG